MSGSVFNRYEKKFLLPQEQYERLRERLDPYMREAYDFTEKGAPPQRLANRVEEQICGEIVFFLQRYPLRRRLYLAYDRLAFSGIEDPSFRVTFDTSIRSRRNEVALEKGDAGTELLPGGLHLMEIKISGAVPHWFAKILSELDIRPISFSKYGNIIRREHGAPMQWVTGKTICEEENDMWWVSGGSLYGDEKPLPWAAGRAPYEEVKIC